MDHCGRFVDVSGLVDVSGQTSTGRITVAREERWDRMKMGRALLQRPARLTRAPAPSSRTPKETRTPHAYPGPHSSSAPFRRRGKPPLIPDAVTGLGSPNVVPPTWHCVLAVPIHLTLTLDRHRLPPHLTSYAVFLHLTHPIPVLTPSHFTSPHPHPYARSPQPSLTVSRRNRAVSKLSSARSLVAPGAPIQFTSSCFVAYNDTGSARSLFASDPNVGGPAFSDAWSNGWLNSDREHDWDRDRRTVWGRGARRAVRSGMGRRDAFCFSYSLTALVCIADAGQAPWAQIVHVKKVHHVRESRGFGFVTRRPYVFGRPNAVPTAEPCLFARPHACSTLSIAASLELSIRRAPRPEGRSLLGDTRVRSACHNLQAARRALTFLHTHTLDATPREPKLDPHHPLHAQHASLAFLTTHFLLSSRRLPATGVFGRVFGSRRLYRHFSSSNYHSLQIRTCAWCIPSTADTTPRVRAALCCNCPPIASYPPLPTFSLLK
ncbi:hypothetical protein B0H12DRAFT_1243087 [Mycena haematopus]|nr:hypothetical protein B0H12DRAFT_1243087 [Mycena haematopus]